MSKVAISYSDIGRAEGEAKAVAKKLDKYADSLNSAVYKKLNRYDGPNTGNISSAKTAVNNKIKALEAEAEKYRNYADDLSDLKDECKSVDNAVKSKVFSLTASFKKTHGIKNNVVVNTLGYFFTSIGNSSSVGRWLNDKGDTLERNRDYLKQYIEDWYDYNGGKEFIKGALVAVLEIAIAIVSIIVIVTGTITGVWAIVAAVAGVVAAVIAGVNGIVNLVNEGRALGYADDDPATARRKSELDTMQQTMRTESDSQFWHNVATGIDFVNIVCSVITIIDGAGKLIKNGYKWATGNTDMLKDLRVKEILTKENFGKFFNKLKTSFTSGIDDIGNALKKKDWAFFGKNMLDFGSDFFTNLKNSFTFKEVAAGATKAEKIAALNKNAKIFKNILSINKDYVEAGFKYNGAKLIERLVIPNIGIAQVNTITIPEDGGQLKFDFDSIKLKDLFDLKDIKTKFIDKVGGLLDDGYVSSQTLETLNTPIEINISIPENLVPKVDIPVIRVA